MRSKHWLAGSPDCPQGRSILVQRNRDYAQRDSRCAVSCAILWFHYDAAEVWCAGHWISPSSTTLGRS